MADASPLITVVIATYNRSNVLRYAVESVRRQTLSDWELWVVGDACTDDTEAVVRAFDDPRIHFVNLPTNVGDQSGPNNEGVRRARGRYLAYLNHDDLWFPDHLATTVQALTDTGADLVAPLVVKGRTDGVFTCGDLNVERRYTPYLSIPASFWVLRRELADAVGPWAHHRARHATPSQDWLYRAACAGKDLRVIPHVTAIALPSGGRPDAYARREHLENQRLFERIHHEPGFRERLLVEIVEHYAILQACPPVRDSIVATYRDFVRRRLAAYWHWPKARDYTSPLAVALRARSRRALAAVRVHPEAVELALGYGRRGGFIRYLRRLRGLPDRG